MAKKYDFQVLEPQGVLTWFKRICSVPHGSGFEKQLCDLLARDLEKAGCNVKRFPTGAILAYKKATKGLEKLPCTLLQAHTDMVLAQEEGMMLDLTKQAITPYYDTEKKWLKAEGTTLGADNGIAVAMMMEVMTNPEIEHGPLECLFTTGEETDPSICLSTIPVGAFKSTQVINLDCDKETHLFFASGAFTCLQFYCDLKFAPIKKGTKTFNINFKKFTGGHSGLEIHNNHINAIIFLMDILREFVKKHDIRLAGLKAGIAANVIPPYISCDIQMEPKYLNELKDFVAQKLDTALVISQYYDKDLVWSITETDQVKECVTLAQSKELYGMMSVIPNGAFNISVQGNCMYNSSNFGSARIFDGRLECALSTRSFVKEDAVDIRCKAIEILKHFGLTEKNITRKEGCNAWLVREPDKSPLIQEWIKNYEKVYGKKPLLMPNPGGLEIADVISKQPIMSLNSLAAGPRIWAEHTPNESCPLDSIQKLWKILLLTLKGIK